MGQERENLPSTPTKWLGKAMLWALRMFFVVLLGIAVGVAAFAGGQYVYRQYWEPVPVHAIRIDILDGRQKQIAEQLAQQRNELQGRVDELELQNDGHKLALDELRERLVAIETPQAKESARLDTAYVELAQLQETLAQAQQTLEGAQLMQDAFLATLEDLQAADAAGHADRQAQQIALAELEGALETAQDELVVMQARVVDLSEQMDAQGIELAAAGEELSGPRSPAALQHELQRVVAMQWLIRARLVLGQNNLGLAQVDLLAARRVLAALQADLPVDQGAYIAQVVERLDAALGHLPAAPVAAADELEGAWQLLVAGLSPEATAVPASEITSETTPTPEASPEATPAPEATPTVEATPEAEASPTSTPEATPTPTPTPQS